MEATWLPIKNSGEQAVAVASGCQEGPRANGGSKRRDSGLGARDSQKRANFVFEVFANPVIFPPACRTVLG